MQGESGVKGHLDSSRSDSDLVANVTVLIPISGLPPVGNSSHGLEPVVGDLGARFAKGRSSSSSSLRVGGRGKRVGESSAEGVGDTGGVRAGEKAGDGEGDRS